MAGEQVKNRIDPATGSGNNNNTVHLGGSVKQGSGDVELLDHFSITAAAGAANTATVTFNALSHNNDLLARVHTFDLWLSDAATGAGITGTTASGTVGATTGTDLVVLTAKKAIKAQTDANGVYVLSIADTAKTQFYVTAQNPWTGLLTVTRVLTANYG